jgi:hypothetical protein
MGKVAVVLYVAAMAAIIVAVDFAFFRHRFMERLIVNIDIVLVFAAFYCRFLRPRGNRMPPCELDRHCQLRPGVIHVADGLADLLGFRTS